MIDDALVDPRPAGQRWHWIALALIVIGGSILRFTLLNRPCLWGDESLVYWRTCGTYNQLLQCLKDDGFTPLHYELAWLIAQKFRPTPVVLRLVPALCGSLTIAAVYFLARQLLDRRVALLAALLTAASAFGFFYSRDAKMYGELWLCCTLNLGCLLWWLRTGRSTAWLGWVAAGCMAAGIHADGMILPALSPLLLLTSRRPRWTGALWLTLGLLVIVLGPAGYYGTFNIWNKRVEDYGWSASGLGWIDMANQDRTGPDMVRCLWSSFAIGWTYPTPPLLKTVSPRSLHVLQWTLGIVIALLAIGVAPWPMKWRPAPRAVPAQPAWRCLLWIALLVVPIGYGFYCHSMPGFASPVDGWERFVEAMPRWLIGLFSHRPVQVIAVVFVTGAIVAGAIYRPTRAHTVRAIQIAIVTAVIIGSCAIVYAAMAPMAEAADLADRRWHSLWIARYLGFLWPLLTICSAVLLLRLPTRPLRVVAIVLLVAVNLTVIDRRLFGNTEPPVDRMAADVIACQPAGSHLRAYVNGSRGDPNPGGGDLFSSPGRYYLQLLDPHKPMSPSQFHRILYNYHFNNGYIPKTIAQEVLATPTLDRIVTWTSTSGSTQIEDDSLLPLMTGWSRLSEQKYAVTDYWDYKPMLNCVRREYVKSPKLPPH